MLWQDIEINLSMTLQLVRLEMTENICQCLKIFGYLVERVQKAPKLLHLQGGQKSWRNSDVQYFQKKLYKALNVPISRLESENGFNMGKAAEITRDELKFTKFVQRLRKRFTQVFNDILKTQLVLKGIITIEDWVSIKEHIQYTFLKDGYFAELKNAEILRERIASCK